jgi:hypothetical protein
LILHPVTGVPHDPLFDFLRVSEISVSMGIKKKKKKKKKEERGRIVAKRESGL